MDFNQSPYFDDFDEKKQYHKVLFKPGTAVQTREMNQLQSILQNQISKFGNHMFKDGSMVIPGAVKYNSKLTYLKVASTQLGANSLDWLVDKVISTDSLGSGVKAQVVMAIAATTTDPITLVIRYTGAEQDASGTDNVYFQKGSTLYVANEGSYTITLQNGDDSQGQSVVASLDTGIYYINGFFVTVPSYVISVVKYVTDITTLNCRIGLQYTEEIITHQEDASLVDNAAGSRNYSAPGADRYKISTDFVVTDLNSNPTNFYELITVQDGVLQQIVNDTQYNILQDTLARRTFDESGNYIVEDFKFDIREDRTNNRGDWSSTTQYTVNDFITDAASGRAFVCIKSGTTSGTRPTNFATADESTSITDGGVRWRYTSAPVSNRGLNLNGNSSNVVLNFGLGKAYIQGYEVRKTNNTSLTIPKARDTREEQNRSQLVPIGNYIYVNKDRSYGLPDVSAANVVNFYDRIVGDTTIQKFGYGNYVGSARLQWMDYDGIGALKAGLTDIHMENGKNFDRDVNSIIVPGSDSSNTTTKTYQLTGAVRYTGATTGYVNLAGRLIFAGSTSSFFSSVSIAAGSNMPVLASGPINFNTEFRVGDVFTLGSSSNIVTSSWTVKTINSDSSMAVVGGQLSAGFGGVPGYVHSTTSLVYLGAVGNVAATGAGVLVTVSSASQIFAALPTTSNALNVVFFIGNSSTLASGSVAGCTSFMVTLRNSTTSISFVTGYAAGTSSNSGTITPGTSLTTLLVTPGIGVVYYNAATSATVINQFRPGTIQADTGGARFQSELRAGDRIYLNTVDVSSLVTVNSILNENRMLVTTGVATTYGLDGSAATNYGIFYQGVSAKYAGDVYQNYSLGINAKKLTGLFQLLDFAGGTTTVGLHQAVQIKGTNDSRLVAELSVNDLLYVNDNKIFVTKVSSNSVAYGVSLTNTITGGSAQYPALRLSNTLKDTDKTSLIYPVENALQSVADNVYYVYRTVSQAATPGDTTVAIQLAIGGSGAAKDSVATIDNSYFLVAQDVVGTLSTPIQVTGVSVDSGTNVMTLQLATPITGSSVRVIYPVKRNASNASSLAGVRSKTLQFDASDEFLSSSTATQSKLKLSHADIYRVNKIMMANSFVSTWDASVQSAATDVTRNYNLDDGQRDTYYDLGSATLKPGYPTPTGSVKVFYDYFSHGTGDFFAYSSYTGLPYEVLPTYNNVNLADVLDFRSAMTVAGTLTNATTPRYGTDFQADISYYLGRKEKIFLDRNSTFYRVTSASDIVPRDPVVPDTNSNLNLYNLTLEPYTRGTEFPYIATEKIRARRYTMKDIGAIDKRVDSLERVTSLSLLETKTSSLQVRDNKDPTLERYKTGFFVDNFTDSTNADQSGDARFAIDEIANTLNPSVSYYNFPLVEKINYTAASITELEEYPIRAVRNDLNYAITGDLLTLDFTTAALITQGIATTSVSIQPYAGENYNGSLKMIPDADIYRSVNSLNVITGVDTTANLTKAAYNAAVAKLRASGDNRPFTVTREFINIFESAGVSVGTAPFCRANTILLKVFGLKPNTKHYAFFDDEGIGAFVTGATKLTFNALPVLGFENNRPNAKTQWARWRSQWETKDGRGIIRSRQVKSGRKTKWVYDYGTIRITNNPRAREVYLPSTSRGDSFKKALEAGVAVYYYQGGWQGSGVAVHQDGNTLYVVNQRGWLSPTFMRGRVNQTQNFNGYFYLADLAAPYVYLNQIAQTAGNMLTDTINGNIFTDAKGQWFGLFDLPDTDLVKFLSGQKPLVITDSADNDPDVWNSRAEAVYTADGTVVTVTKDFQSTKSYILHPYTPRSDPIAQSFSLPQQYTAGVFVSDIDVFFRAKPEANYQVRLELRACDSTGRPSTTEFIPGTVVTLDQADINIDAKGLIATKFKFKQPVYLLPNKNYAFVLQSDSKVYQVWTAQIGQQDVANPKQTYSTQGLLGSLFRSQDTTLWTEDQLSDLKFNLNRCVFNTNVASTTYVVNHNLQSEPLAANPFTFLHGSNKIKVGHKNHGFRNGDTVRFYSEYWSTQYAANPAITIFGIPVSEIFAESLTAEQTLDNHTSYIVSDVTLDTYVISVTTPASISASAQAGVTKAIGGGENIQANTNSIYHVVTPGARALTFQDTTLSMQGSMINGVTYDNDAGTDSNYSMSTQDLNFNSINFLNEPKVILTDTNEANRFAGISITTGSGGTSTWQDSFIGKINMISTNDAVSPAIDLSTFYLGTIQQRIDNPSKVRRLPTTLPAIGTTSTFVNVSAIVEGNVNISVNGITNSYETVAQTGLFNNVTPGNYLIVSGFNNQANNNTSTGVLVTDVSPDGTKIYVNQDLTNEAAGAAISIYQNEDFTEEATRLDASGESKYIIKKVNLENPATSLKVLFDVNLPSAADFDLYYKIGAAATDFDTLVWKQFTQLPAITRNDTRGVFSEITIDVTDFDADGNTKDFTSFTAFQVKIVFRSTNGARAPQFKNMRVIAHA